MYLDGCHGYYVFPRLKEDVLIGQDSTDQESSHTDLIKGHDRETSGTDSTRKHDQGPTDDVDAIRRHSEVIVTKHCTSQSQSRSTSASSTPRKLSPLLVCPPRSHLSSSSSVTPDVTSPTTKQRSTGSSDPKLQILPPEGEHPLWTLQCVEWSACMHVYMRVWVHIRVYYSMIRCTAVFFSPRPPSTSTSTSPSTVRHDTPASQGNCEY